MKKLLPILFLFVTMMAWAGNVSQEEALQKAKAFINSRRITATAQHKMQLAAKELDFLAAAKYRDEIKEMQSLLESAR